MVTLSKEQVNELACHAGEPLRVFDPETNKVYFIVAGDLFDRLKAIFGADFDIRDTYAAQEQSLAKVWSDPA